MKKNQKTPNLKSAATDVAIHFILTSTLTGAFSILQSRYNAGGGDCVVKLAVKQKLFVKEYLIDLNATQAALRAGYSPKTAKEQGARLLSNVNVQAAIQEAMSKRERRTEIKADRVLQELAAVGFAQAVDVVRVVRRETNDGRTYQDVEIVDTDQVPADSRTAIAGIKYGKYGIEIKMHDKIRALEMLGRHLGLFDDNANKDKPDPQAQITALADLINNPAPERVLDDD